MKKERKIKVVETKNNNIKLYSIIVTIIVIILIAIIAIMLLIPKNIISENEAKNRALTYSNFSENEIIFLNIEKDYDDYVYEIKFKNDNYIYEVDVHMKTGEIINFERDAINQTNISGNEPEFAVTEEEAKEIALKYVNLKSNEVTFTKINNDIENGHSVYEVEFYSIDAEYEISIDIDTKEIIKYDIDYKEKQNTNSDYIGISKAKEIALNHANLNESDITWHKAKLDNEYNYSIYEIEFIYEYKEYDYEIDAYSGEIINYEIDYN